MIHPLVILPSAPTAETPVSEPKINKEVKRATLLADLSAGEEGLILRVTLQDAPCRRRLAELGIAEGMVVAVAGAGETMMLALGSSRFGLARSCASHIEVMRRRSK